MKEERKEERKDKEIVRKKGKKGNKKGTRDKHRMNGRKNFTDFVSSTLFFFGSGDRHVVDDCWWSTVSGSSMSMLVEALTQEVSAPM